MQIVNPQVTCLGCDWEGDSVELDDQTFPDDERTEFYCPKCSLILAQKKKGERANFIPENADVQL